MVDLKLDSLLTASRGLCILTGTTAIVGLLLTYIAKISCCNTTRTRSPFEIGGGSSLYDI